MGNKIPELGTELKQTHLTQYEIHVQGHDLITQRYYYMMRLEQKESKYCRIKVKHKNG